MVAGGRARRDRRRVVDERGLRGGVDRPLHGEQGGALSFVRAASLDLARHGIRINAVAPGMVRTRMAAPLTEDAEAAAEFLRNVPLGRFAEPADIAAVVGFLASERSRYVTGSLVVADGG